jgi:hypothetical protein
MRGASVLGELSRRTPLIVVVSLCVAIVADWVEAPVWLPYGLAIGLAGMALMFMARRNHRPAADPDSEDTGWLAQELAGNGSPSGTYPLAFCAVVAIALNGFQEAYSAPGWVALVLIAAWAMANARYPANDEADGPPRLSD